MANLLTRDTALVGNLQTLPHGWIAPGGKTGAIAATRWVGGTASGAPVSGTFKRGDFVIAQDGGVWVCTVASVGAGQGTWVRVGGATAATAITAQSASAFVVSLDGVNPAFVVDSSTGSSATGVKVKSGIASGGVELGVVSTANNEALNVDAKGSGEIVLAPVSTGKIRHKRDVINEGKTILSASALGSSTGSVTATTASHDYQTIVLTGPVTLNADSVAVAGTLYVIQVTTDVGDDALTFGTGFRSTGTVAPGASKTMVVTFRSDGTNWVEASRTAAGLT